MVDLVFTTFNQALGSFTFLLGTLLLVQVVTGLWRPLTFRSKTGVFQFKIIILSGLQRLLRTSINKGELLMLLSLVSIHAATNFLLIGARGTPVSVERLDLLIFLLIGLALVFEILQLGSRRQSSENGEFLSIHLFWVLIVILFITQGLLLAEKTSSIQELWQVEFLAVRFPFHFLTFLTMLAVGAGYQSVLEKQLSLVRFLQINFLNIFWASFISVTFLNFGESSFFSFYLSLVLKAAGILVVRELIGSYIVNQRFDQKEKVILGLAIPSAVFSFLCLLLWGLML